jgi:outer membrane protein
MEEARKRIEAQQKSLSQAEKALQISQTRYRSGIGTQLELLDTQVAMTLAKTNYSQAIYDYLTAKADWQYYVGNSR